MPTASPCPFVAAGRIEDPALFVGRHETMKFIANRMLGAQATSVNIVGTPRIGRSSLLYHFSRHWQSLLPPERQARYQVAYLSLADAQVGDEAHFYQAAVAVLCGDAAAPATTRQDFNAILQRQQREGRLPVLCLDDFEALFHRPNAFDDGFFDNLRYLMGANALMLVVASRQTLAEYQRQHKLTSNFFNQGHEHRLQGLSGGDAKRLVASGGALTAIERQTALAWGGKHPYFLQLAGLCLCEAKQQGKDAHWAKRQFEQQMRSLDGYKPWRLWRYVRVGLCWLGNMAEKIGHLEHQAKQMLIGIVVLVLLLLALVGPLSWEKLAHGLPH